MRRIGEVLNRGIGVAWHGRLGVAIRVLVTIALLALVLRQVDLAALQHDVARVPLGVAALVAVLSFVPWILNSYKWRCILGWFDLHRGLEELVRLNLASVFYGLVLPGQIGGEVLKGIRLAHRSEQRAAVYVSILLDRVTGLVVLVGLGAVFLVLDPPPNVDWQVLGSLLAVLLGASVAGILFLLLPHGLRVIPRGRFPAGRLVDRLTTWVLSLSMVNGRAATPQQVVHALGLSVLSQSIILGVIWVLAAALGIGASLYALTWITAVTALLQMLPISVAGIGPREATMVSLLSWYGVPPNLSLTLALLLFGVLVLLAVVGGGLELLPDSNHPRPRFAHERARGGLQQR